jgi:glycine reductase complex component B subunit gamma
MLTPIPDVARAVGAPRIAAIEYPLGQTLGRPGDAAGQQAVLRAVLAALENIITPGEIVHLPFEWTGGEPCEPHEPPPIARYITRHPWLLPRLLRRDVPEREQA